MSKGADEQEERIERLAQDLLEAILSGKAGLEIRPLVAPVRADRRATSSFRPSCRASPFG